MQKLSKMIMGDKQIDAIISEYSPVSDIDNAIQNMYLEIDRLKHELSLASKDGLLLFPFKGTP